MNDHSILAAVSTLFGTGYVYRYALVPSHLRKLSTHTLTALSEAIEAGMVSERYSRSGGIVELRLTRLGRRSVKSYQNWKERVA
jgi:hypothetical protein